MSSIVELDSGGASARLVPAAGGRISSLRLERPAGSAVEVLYPYPEDFFDPFRWAKGGIYPLLPYSNRIANATVLVQGAAVPLQPHPDAAPHTLHGNAHAQPWLLDQASASSAVMTLDSAPGPAWPWRYRGRLLVRLEPSALSIRIEICNTDTRPMPAGIGLHPYFRHQAEGRVAYRASAFWPATPDFLATGSRSPRADESHAVARALRAGGLTDYLGGWDGSALVELPEGVYLRISAEPVFSHLVVHRPDNLAYVCLEPVSHVADGFNLAERGIAGTGARLLAPGETLGGELRLQLVEEPS